MNVLVTYGWCRTAYAVARSLSAAGHNVFVCGSSRLAMTRASRYVEGSDLVPDPFSHPAEFAQAVSQVVRQRRIDVVVPVHEDALPIQTHRSLLPPTTIVAAPSEQVLRRALDKGFMSHLAEAAGLRAPETQQPATMAEAERYLQSVQPPVVIKTRRGNSGKGVVIAKTQEEARAAFASLIQ
ncbi:MAG: hypothetical protein H5T84_11010, partial [Thermoleophilia bacterium]|nr:hypothetical protein [Thermoleophilia bacterium]